MMTILLLDDDESTRGGAREGEQPVLTLPERLHSAHPHSRAKIQRLSN